MDAGLILLVVIAVAIVLVIWDLRRMERKADEAIARRDKPFPERPRRSGQASDGSWVSDLADVGGGDGDGGGDGGGH